MGDSELESLFAKYSPGDVACESELSSAIVVRVCRWLTPRLGPQHQGNVDDLANETASEVIQQFRKGQRPAQGAAGTWLYQVATLKMLTYLRAWYRSEGGLKKFADLCGHEPDDDFQHRVENQELVEKVVAGLQGHDKQIAVGIAQDRSLDEMLAETGLSRATYFRLKARLLKKLKKDLMHLCSVLFTIWIMALL